ncbi:MAG: transporter substrate-binding domain-containing protein [Coriobacteriaceae bacterium]|jgi:polar amino acid transport system substrate-binding protein|nr:transporter substrate-binding domain-containing protein [Coriobacteriaceae bacterium]
MKKLRYLAVFAAAFALAAFVLAGCGSSNASKSDSASASGSAAASGSGFTLVVGFDSEYPPYGFLDASGNPTGFDIDLAKAVADANGWGFEAKAIDWDSKDLELQSGNINCIWNGFTMEGREGKYTFSDPYMLNEQVIVVASGSDVKSLKDLAGKKVITQAGSAAFDLLSADGDQADLAKTFDGGAVQTIADYNNAFLQLESGAIDAVACDLSIAQYQISQTGSKYVQLGENLTSEHYAVGFKTGDDSTAKTVTDSLKKLDSDGTVKKLCEKYAEYGLSYDNWILK